MSTQCPNCGSTDLTVVNNQYNIKKGIIGFIFLNSPGLLNGVNKEQYEVVCINCGCHWPPGQKHQALKSNTVDHESYLAEYKPMVTLIVTVALLVLLVLAAVFC